MNEVLITLTVLACSSGVIAIWACKANSLLQYELDRLNTYANPLEEQIIRHVQEKWAMNLENTKLKEQIRQLQRNIAELKHEVEQKPPF